MLGYHIAAYLLLSLLIFFLIKMLGKARKDAAIKTEKFNAQIVTLDKRILHAKKQLEATFDSISDGIVVIDKNYNITRLNQTYAKFTNKSIDNILLRKCYKTFRNLDEPCKECPITNMKYADGYGINIGKHNFQVEVKSTLVGGNVQNHIETIRDVTRFENLHLQLRRSERFATIGTMVAGIAHEMNNPLSGISGNSQLMIKYPEKYGLNDKGVSRIKTIYDSVQRATGIVSDLLNFSNPNQIKYKPISLLEAANAAVQKVKIKYKIGEKINWKADGESARIWGDPSQIDSVLIRVLENSIQALEEKMEMEPDLVPQISIKLLHQENNFVLQITDNGIGIPEQALSNIFDPFFTTKEPGIGVGLGLSICHRIMSEHQGKIVIKPQKEGALTELIFPGEKPEG